MVCSVLNLNFVSLKVRLKFVQIQVGKLVASIIPKLPVEKLDPKLVSRDPDVVRLLSLYVVLLFV